MSPRWRKRALLALLFGLLGTWVVVQYLWSDRAHEHYARQALDVHRVAVAPIAGDGPRVDAPGPDRPLSEGLPAEIVGALDPRLDFVSSCLMTEAGTRAPLTLEIELRSDGPRPGSLNAELREGALDDEEVACLEDAIEPVEWPPVEHAVALSIEFADGRFVTRRALALEQAARLSNPSSD